MPMYGHDGYFWGMHGLWWLFWLILLVLLFTVAPPVPKRSPRRETPLDILQRRYAAGELSTEEYEQRRAVLERETPRGP